MGGWGECYVCGVVDRGEVVWVDRPDFADIGDVVDVCEDHLGGGIRPNGSLGTPPCCSSSGGVGNRLLGLGGLGR